jgi:high-affinity iron transporter
MGLWLGVYPTWEGLLIPLAGIGYVAGAWLYNKWQVRREKVNAQVKSGAEMPELAENPLK